LNEVDARYGRHGTVPLTVQCLSNPMCVQATQKSKRAEIAELKGQIQTLSERTQELTRNAFECHEREAAPYAMAEIGGTTAGGQPSAQEHADKSTSHKSLYVRSHEKITLKVQQKIDELGLDEKGALQFQVDYLHDVNAALAQQGAAALEAAAAKDAIIANQQDDIDSLQVSPGYALSDYVPSSFACDFFFKLTGQG